MSHLQQNVTRIFTDIIILVLYLFFKPHIENIHLYMESADHDDAYFRAYVNRKTIFEDV